MEKKNLFQLTETDKEAITLCDSNYINSKGAELYGNEGYLDALEYYHLAATMGNDQAISNIGYYYLYGRDIPQNISLAEAYFKIAAYKGNKIASYKLGNIYETDEWGLKDEEKAIYYCRMSVSQTLEDDGDENKPLLYHFELQENPSLCYAMGRALSPNGLMNTNIRDAYQFLLHAKRGYEIAIINGDDFLKDSLSGVKKLINNKCFDEIREEFDNEFKYTYYTEADDEDEEYE